MKISIDIETVFSNPTGIGRVVRETLRELATIDTTSEYWLFHSNLYSSDDLNDIINLPTNWHVQQIPASRRLLRVSAIVGMLPPNLRSKFPRDIDVAFAPSGYMIPIPARRKVGMIYDINIIDLAEANGRMERFITRLEYRSVVRKADALVTISEFSRKRIVEHWDLPSSFVTALPLGVAQSFSAKKSVQSESPYFIWAGVMSRRKNVLTLIKAFSQATDRLQNERLVIAGPDGQDTQSAKKLVEELQLQDRVEFVGFLTDCDLSNLISGALAFVFPSTYEGFGLPIIEAMSLGTPVITSDATSTAEVGADKAILIDPSSLSEIADAMVRVGTDSDLRAQLSQNGLKHAETFTWRKFAHGVLETLRDGIIG